MPFFVVVYYAEQAIPLKRREKCPSLLVNIYWRYYLSIQKYGRLSLFFFTLILLILVSYIYNSTNTLSNHIRTKHIQIRNPRLLSFLFEWRRRKKTIEILRSFRNISRWFRAFVFSSFIHFIHSVCFKQNYR